MKRILLALVAVMTVSAFVMAKTENEKITFKVNMHCASCQQKIEKNIAFEKGVKDLKVNLEEKTVCVTYDASKTNADKLKAGFAKIGYEASAETPKACTKASSDGKACVKEGEKQCCKQAADGKVCAKEGEKKCTTEKTACPNEKKI